MRERILNQLETAWAGKTCLCFDTLTSTNDYGKELAKQRNVHGTLIVADRQTAGRGRRGRSWEGKSGDSIAMSLCLEPRFSPEKAAGLTLVMALAAAEAVLEVTKAKPQIKWPNDLVVNGKKICGILTELFFTPDGYAVIVGVGINANTMRFSKELTDTASSLRLETGQEIVREQLIASVMKHFEKAYELYEQTEDMSLLKERYEALLVNLERSVRVLDPRGAYDGIARGINDAGNLIVDASDGTRKEIDSGEVSVRGIYGYV